MEWTTNDFLMLFESFVTKNLFLETLSIFKKNFNLKNTSLKYPNDYIWSDELFDQKVAKLVESRLFSKASITKFCIRVRILVFLLRGFLLKVISDLLIRTGIN